MSHITNITPINQTTETVPYVPLVVNNDSNVPTAESNIINNNDVKVTPTPTKVLTSRPVIAVRTTPSPSTSTSVTPRTVTKVTPSRVTPSRVTPSRIRGGICIPRAINYSGAICSNPVTPPTINTTMRAKLNVVSKPAHTPRLLDVSKFTIIDKINSAPVRTTPSKVKPIPANQFSHITKQKLVLHPHQLDWAERSKNILATQKGYFDFSDPGSGKTVIAINNAKEYNLSIFCIAPLTSGHQWLTECYKYDQPIETVVGFESLRSKIGKLDVDRELANGWLIRRDWVTDGGQKRKSFKVTNAFKSLVAKGILLIIDESMFIKNDSAQYRAVKALMTEIIVSSGPSRYGILCGTPLTAIDHALNYLKLISYITEQKLYHINDGEVVLDGMQQLINICNDIDPVATLEILKDLPEHATRGLPSIMRNKCYELFCGVVKYHISGSMTPHELEGTHVIGNYFANITPDRIEELNKRITELTKVTEYDAATGEVGIKGNLSGITKTLILIESALIYDMCRNITKVLEADESAKGIICINYPTANLQPILDIMYGYNPLVLTGAVKKDLRSDIIKKFNEDPKYRFLIMNISVGGVGVNLHDALGIRSKTVMLISPNYHADKLIQAPKRIKRVGTLSDTFVGMFYGKSEIVNLVNVFNSLSRKALTLKGVLDDNPDNRPTLPDEYQRFDEDEFDITA